jgi:hypothetical protein
MVEQRRRCLEGRQEKKSWIDEFRGIGVGRVAFLQARELVGKRVVASFTVQRQLVEGEGLPSSPNIRVHVSNGRAY